MGFETIQIKVLLTLLDATVVVVFVDVFFVAVVVVVVIADYTVFSFGQKMYF